jgi:hypothetical protein
VPILFQAVPSPGIRARRFIGSTLEMVQRRPSGLPIRYKRTFTQAARSYGAFAEMAISGNAPVREWQEAGKSDVDWSGSTTRTGNQIRIR